VLLTKYFTSGYFCLLLRQTLSLDMWKDLLEAHKSIPVCNQLNLMNYPEFCCK